MQNKDKIEIPMSKGKLIKILFFSILFLVASLWILLDQPEVGNPIFNNLIIKNTASVLGTLMGLFGIYFCTKKIFDKKPGVIIDNIGIIDNSSGVSLGRIPWTDVMTVAERTVITQKMITIYLKNPDDYINKESSSIKRKMLKMNLKESGSPVSISANGLKIPFNELKYAITQKFEEFQANKTLD
ncbi:STM3941 family protein [Flavobacterium hydatis]|uniref:Uncharacterized protein n=1 Tax=Flavobacterium hydatis TaxID=991 RepID=A0A086AEI8_FLAHY|nr:STM3941 family protein [Flavobacterium hydatis]KFF15102.1 hypothetical protein IW20_15710 [Flavobacterium hydatis]OXA91956.1 hypothetical protein B0A62_16280 [Flavobacterium hydatis]